MNFRFKIPIAVTCVIAILFSCNSDKPGNDKTENKVEEALEPTAIETNPLKEAYFGETHLHTAYSLDAYLGGTRLYPSDAYRFAKGETVEVNGEKITISKPLDFCAVTDHAEYLGEMYANSTPGSPGYDNDKLKLLSIPVMKNHRSAGVTGALKLYFGVLSIHWYNAEYHDNIGLTCAEMFSHIRSPDLNIMDLTWLPVNAVNGHPDTLPQRTNKILASTDPLALDYWISKHVLFPLSINPLHNPDEPLKFRMKTLLPAKEEFDKCEGIRGNNVNMKDEDIIVYERAM